MSDTYLTDGGIQVPSKAERLEHAQISGVHGKKVFNIDKEGNIIDGNTVQMGETIPMLRAILIAIANPSYVDKSANAIRNQVQSGTITTVTTVTNLGSFPADHLQRMGNMAAWATNIRSLIT